MRGCVILKNNILIDVKDLSIGFDRNGQVKNVVKDISFQVKEGEILGIVGESGSGKTMTALSIIGLLPHDAYITNGSIVFDKMDLFEIDKELRRELRGRQISMIFQEPMTSLNPSMKIGYQVEEMLTLHEPNLGKLEKKEKTLDALKEAGLDNIQGIYNKYPHELSGGMRQRAMIAMAMLCKPKVLIADEPTTALDVTTQAKILNLIEELSRNYGTTVILISHNLGVIKKICSKVIVMEDGNIVEEGKVSQIFTNPQENYTKQLILSMPVIDKLRTYKKPDPIKEKILEIKNLNVFYNEKGGLFSKKEKNHVVKDASLFVERGETLGIVGESGSGKSTLAKAILGMIKDTRGEVIHHNIKPQMVFQDPYSSLNPAKTVNWILEEPLKLEGKLDKEERKRKVLQILKEVGLDKKYGPHYLSQLSGGQRQRVAIGAALILNPQFIVLDEPVSALDVTVQYQILKLLKKLRKEHNLSYLFISHDLNVVYQICDRVCVMCKGEIVETGSINDLFYNPQHEYSKKLLSSVL